MNFFSLSENFFSLLSFYNEILSFHFLYFKRARCCDTSGFFYGTMESRIYGTTEYPSIPFYTFYTL